MLTQACKGYQLNRPRCIPKQSAGFTFFIQSFGNFYQNVNERQNVYLCCFSAIVVGLTYTLTLCTSYNQCMLMFMSIWLTPDSPNCVLAIKMFFKTPLPPIWLLLGSPMLIDPHPSQQHAGLHHAVRQLQQEVARPKARFKTTSLKQSGVDGGSKSGANISRSDQRKCFSCPFLIGERSLKGAQK